MLPKNGTGNNPLIETFAKNVSSHVASGLFAVGSSKKDPMHSTVGMGPTVAIKKGDGQATILAKMYRFMLNDTKEKKKQELQYRKFRKYEEESKEKRNEELTEALVGKGPTEGVPTDKPVNAALYMSAGLGILGLMYAPDVSAKIQELIGAFDTSGIAEKFRTISNIFSSMSISQKIGPSDYDQLFQKYEKQYDIPTGLLKSVAKVESQFNPKATSPKGAKGLMQIMPENFASLGISNPEDPEQNVRGGAKHLSRLLKKYGDIETAISAYNAGEGNMAKHDNKVPFKETKDYTKKVLGYYKSGAYSTPDMNVESGPMPDASGLRVKGGIAGQSFGGGATQKGVIDLARKIQSTKIPGEFGQFTAFHDVFHGGANPSSRHNQGLALDYTINDPSKSSEATQITKQILRGAGLSEGKDYNVEDEYKNPSAHATGGHIHVEFKSPQAASTFSGSLGSTQLATQTTTPRTPPTPEKKPTAQGSTTIVEMNKVVVVNKSSGNNSQSSSLRDIPRSDRPN